MISTSSPVRVVPSLRRMACALGTVLVTAGCKGPPVSQPVSIEIEPPAPAPASASAPAMAVPEPPAPAPVDAGTEAPEAPDFSIVCLGRPPRPGGFVYACTIQGRITAVRKVGSVAEAMKFGRREEGPFQAIDLRIDPDPALPCRTPLDGDKTSWRPPETDRSLDLPWTIRMYGGARLAGALTEGTTVCGWTTRVQQAGLGYPAGWEGQLADGKGTVLAAWSLAFAPKDSPTLARSWRFSREGPVERRQIDEGGAFVYHRSVRVHHGGASALSVGGAESILRGRDGTFAVRATSDLTEGNTPIFVGKHDGFGFSAVRVSGK